MRERWRSRGGQPPGIKSPDRRGRGISLHVRLPLGHGAPVQCCRGRHGPPWPNFRSILTSFNIIIAKWGDDRKSAFRQILPPKKFPVAFQATGNFQRRPEIGDFAWDFLARKFPVPFMLPESGDSARYFLPVMFTSLGATMQGGLQCRSGLFNPGGGCKKMPFRSLYASFE